MQQSTTRENVYSLHSGLNDIIFQDTFPNHIYVNNLSNSELFIGVGMLPSETAYDKYVAPTSDTLYARENGMTRFSIFVKGGGADIKVTSFDAPFNPSTLASGTTSMSKAANDKPDFVPFDGIVKGINTPLPTGNNNIGKVIVSELPVLDFPQKPLVASNAKIGKVDITDMPSLPTGSNKIGSVDVGSMPALPNGTNNIGKVDVNSLPALPTGSNKIGNVGISGGVVITEMPAIKLESEINLDGASVTIADDLKISEMPLVEMKAKNNYFSFDQSVTTDNTNIPFGFTSKNIKYISNDGESDIYISFGDSPKTTTGLMGRIRLASGETLNELDFETTAINISAGTGSCIVRGVIV